MYIAQRIIQPMLYQNINWRVLSFHSGIALYAEYMSCRYMGVLAPDVLGAEDKRVLADDAGEERNVVERARVGLVSARTMVMNMVIPSEKSSHSTQTNMYRSLISCAVNDLRKKRSFVLPEQFFWP